MINWMLGPDHSPLETTIAYEQVAIEITASVAQLEPDAYMKQGYRYALLEDFDHLYRYSALLDRLEGKDANNILQSYTDILPSANLVLDVTEASKVRFSAARVMAQAEATQLKAGEVSVSIAGSGSAALWPVVGATTLAMAR